MVEAHSQASSSLTRGVQPQQAQTGEARRRCCRGVGWQVARRGQCRERLADRITPAAADQTERGDDQGPAGLRDDQRQHPSRQELRRRLPRAGRFRLHDCMVWGR